ncbi:hypothetical protein [Alteromonas halophila]|uniref:DUF3570 domain-containing protein n=1 Tax=Alteromonas halophila TaxID=516698 RepID=A0A918JIN4_9ALTE|nr:hypothetical protein [Alteromonas halophila]GGW79229.1 hypothetical protein GCM10007391_09940 [Alteromonas halophila]
MACYWLVVCSTLAMADEVAAVSGIEAAPLIPPPQHTTSDNPQSERSHWLDTWQDGFTESMDYTVRQLDSFFAADGSTAYKNARAEGRIQLAWEPRTRDIAQTDLRFRIRVQLPALENRVDLLLSDNEDESQDNTIRAARDNSMRQRESTTLALRFRPDQDSRLSYRVGAGRRDQLYVKTQFQDASALSRHWAVRYDTELYYYTRDRLGAELGLSVQHVSDTENVVRLNNRFYFRDDSNDWLWRHDVQWLHPIDEKNALLFHTLVEGLSQPSYRVEEVYTGLRWRANRYREWLFFEVEPFVLWLRDESFSPSYGVALRVEAYYGKRS